MWTLIGEVPDGTWGTGGQTVRFADLVRYALDERERPGSAAVPVAST